MQVIKFKTIVKFELPNAVLNCSKLAVLSGTTRNCFNGEGGAPVQIGLRPRLGNVKRRFAARLCASAFLTCSPACAVGAERRRSVLPPTREEVTRPVAPHRSRARPRLEVEGGVERAPCALDGPQYQSIRLTLRGVEFEASRASRASSWRRPMRRSSAATCRFPWFAKSATAPATILRDAGYIAAVQVPEQRIGDGIVRFQVLMAHLTQVRVRGDAAGAERIIAGYLNQLTKQAVFNRNDAERYLLLASDLPGYTVRLTLRPAGGAPGDVVGDVTVQRLAGYADINVQNGGAESLGPWGGAASAASYSA